MHEYCGRGRFSYAQFRPHLAVFLWLLTSFSGIDSRGAEQAQSSSPAYPPILSGCEVDYSPFCIVTGDQQADGFSVELLRAALRAVNREVTFKTGSWAEIKGDLAEGRLQVLPMVARTPERESAFEFTFPYLTMHGTIVVRDSNTDILGPEDLKNKRVAVLREDIAHEYLLRSNLGAVIVPLPSFAVAMRELADGRHDAVVIQKLLAFHLMKEAGLRNLRAVGPPLSGYTQTFCFAAHKGDRELLNLLNEGLSIVMADGTFRRLHAKWFSPLEAMANASSRIVVGGDHDYPPYEFLDRNGQPAGYNVDLTRAIAKQMGLSVEIRLGPWAEVRQGLDRGQIDLVHGMFYSAERDQKFRFSPAHTLIRHVIVVREGTPPVADMQSLAGKSLFVMAGDILHDLALKHGLEKQLVTVSTQEEALRRLAAGEGDCALVAKVPALFWIQKNGWRNLSVGTQAVLSAEYCYAVPRGNEQLIAIFSEGLAAIKKTGDYRAIQAKWLGPYEGSEIGFRTVARYALLGALPVGALLAGSLLWSRSLKVQVRRRTSELQREMETSRRTAEALRQSEERLRLLGDNLPDSVLYEYEPQPGQSGRFLYISAGVERLHGLPAAEVLKDATLLHRQISAEYLPMVIEAEARCAREVSDFDLEVPMVHPDGRRRWMRLHSRPRRLPDGRVIWVGVQTDITERKAFQAELERLVAERTAKLQEMVSELEHFSYTITHDMRAPLRAMQGFADLMTEACAKCPEAEPKMFLQRIETSAARMDSLITDALNYSRAVRQELAVTPMDAGVLLRGMLDSYPEFQPSKAQIQIAGELPLVMGNEAALTQCFSNLIGNAVKFVKTGQKPEITVRGETRDGWVRIWVEDKGIGIPKIMQTRVFELFSRGHQSYQGTGIGLALVRKVVDRMGGRVGVESEEGKGSRFWVELRAVEAGRAGGARRI